MSIFQENITISRPPFLGGGQWGLKNLNEVTILFGKNGSGKSLLLRGWRDTEPDSIHYVIPERTGTLDFESRFLDQQLTGDLRRSVSQYNFTDYYRQQVIPRIHGYFMARGATRENTLSGNPNDLEQLLKFLLPDFSISLRAERPPYVIERLSNNEVIPGIQALSSGEAQLITLALDVLTIAAIWDVNGKDKRVIHIDEPDAHLHPDLQIRFADFLIRVIDKFKAQIVVSTHSTTLLSAIGQFAKDRCSIIYMSTQIAEYTAQKFTENLKEISACLGGHVLMGPLFGAPVLLVEGDDDYRIWSQVPRHGIVNISVIPSNGDEIKQYQKLLEKIFTSISEPKIMGHALLDGDKGLPVANEHNPQIYIPFIQLNCHESENLFITDEVLLELGFDWDQALAKLTAEAVNYGNKYATIEALVNADRRTVDLKSIVNEVSKILDSKNVHWTTRVGNKIGREKPTGQLADFLGEQVVNSLWPQ